MKKFLVEFKSIFTEKDVFKENEKHANIVTATAMLNCFLVEIIVCLLTFLNVLVVDKSSVIFFMLAGIFLLFIPALACFIMKGNGKYLKFVLITFLTIFIVILNSFFTYALILTLVIPVLLVARYYSKKFTIFVIALSTILFGISAYIGSFVGFTDLNYIDVPKGTTITVETTLEDAIDSLSLDQKQKTENTMLQYFIPQAILYVFVIAFACVQVSQSGRKMVDRQKELSEEGARIESELNIARKIQKNMLPSTFPPFPEHNEIDIYAQMIPAKEVGGDFYDMFLIDDNHLAITVADVSGKGVPAALIMMITRTLIKNIALEGDSVEEVFYKVNNLLCEGNTNNNFVTSWFGILDLKTGIMEFTNAGQNPPLKYSKKENKFEYVKVKPNFVLAGLKNSKYTKHTLTLEEGDRIFLYTDGVVEATNLNNELYGDTRLECYLNNNINTSVENTIVGLKNDIDDFVGTAKQFDDITMLELLFKKRKKDDIIEKKFDANLSKLDDVLTFVDSYLMKYHISQKTMRQLELVVEELFANVCNYAYKDEKGYFKVALNMNAKGILQMTLEDEGKEFNPLKIEAPNTKLSINERKIGGMGIFLVKKNMDSIQYQYKDKKNILVLEKMLGKEKYE